MTTVDRLRRNNCSAPTHDTIGPQFQPQSVITNKIDFFLFSKKIINRQTNTKRLGFAISKRETTTNRRMIDALVVFAAQRSGETSVVKATASACARRANEIVRFAFARTEVAAIAGVALGRL